MRTSILTALLVLQFTFAACGGGGSPAPADPPPSPPGGGPGVPPGPIEPGLLGDGRFDDIVSQVRERHDVPAMAAIMVVDGVIVELAADGLRSLDAETEVTVADKWHLGSVGKAMTATLAAVLVEQSVLSWDTTPRDVWPGDAATMHPAYQGITLTQLLAHQAGVQPDQGMIPSIALTADSAAGSVVEKRRLWSRELLELAPANAPGEFNYANGGYIIVGSMLETVTGSSWEALMQDLVFAPLGMMDSGFGAPGTAALIDQPFGHIEQGGSLVAVEPGPNADNSQAIGPAGTVHTTLEDYAKFMFAHLEGELGMPGLVSAETFRLLHTAVGGHDYALGWRLDESQGWADGPLLYHLGSNLRWFANAGLVPGLNSGLLIVMNAASESARATSDDMAELLLTRLLNSQ